MLTALWAKICALFTVEKVGILLKLLLTKVAANISTKLIDQIKNKENQQKAYEFVKELQARSDLTNAEKAKLFNKKMLDWAKTFAKKTLSESVINCLRELAVIAVKTENASKSK